MRMGAPDRAESPGLPTDPDQASAAVLASVSLPRTLPSDLVPVPVSEGNPTCTLGHDFPRRLLGTPVFPLPLAPKFKGLARCRGASEQLQEASAGQTAQTLRHRARGLGFSSHDPRRNRGQRGTARPMSAAGTVSELGAVAGTLQEEGSPRTGA